MLKKFALPWLEWPLVKSAVLDWIYPSSCIHCEQKTLDQSLCSECVDLLQPLNPSEHCKGCFVESDVRFCKECLSTERPFDRIGAVFDYLGPGPTLIKRMKYGRQTWLATSIAAWMVQYHTEVLRWPLPDLIVPAPMAWNKRFLRGFNHSELIAQEMGKFLSVPVSTTLKRRAGDFSQAGLKKEQRVALSNQSFFVKKPESLYDKRILLIDDVMTTGTTLRRCGEALLEGCPVSIDALTFCRTRD